MNDFSKPQQARTAAEPVRYGFKNDEGHRLQIATVGVGLDHVEVSVIGIGDLDWRSLNIPATNIPGIALALLAAAGVTQAHHGDADSLQLALAHLTEHEGIKRNRAATHELNRRRDELTVDLMQQRGFSGNTARYAASPPVAQAAIDMIITLQDEAQQ